MATGEVSQTVESDANAILAAVLSLVIPGVGHLYGGQKKRGLYWLAGLVVFDVIVFVTLFIGIGFLLAFLQPLVHIGAAADAFMQNSN